MNKTPLNKSHIELGAKMVNFSNWEMPISYSSLIEEHNAVRNAAGIFDVSHMSVFDLMDSIKLLSLKKFLPMTLKKSTKITRRFMVLCLMKKVVF